MNTKTSSLGQSRRQFFTKFLPAGAIFCFGCSKLLACDQSEEKSIVSTGQHKFLENSGMSFEEVFNFAFKEFYIPIANNLKKDIGKDKFIEMLKKASSEFAVQIGKNLATSLQKNDIAAFASFMKENELYKHILTYEIVEETDKAFETKVTECLNAKTFREADASDIGYASICHQDYAFVRAFNPKMRLIKNKTLMQGHDFCDPRWVLEG